MDNKTKVLREFGFASQFCEWIEKCLTADEKWEELAYFKMGVDLMVRQSELKHITWSQIDFPYVNNIKIMKVAKDDNGKPLFETGTYEPREISRGTFDVLNKISDTKEERIFRKNDYSQSISESIGTTFNGHMMRKLGFTLRTVAMRLDD